MKITWQGVVGIAVYTIGYLLVLVMLVAGAVAIYGGLAG